MVKSRPHVTLSAAMSMDGKIATRTGNSELSSKEDLIRVHKLRANVDAILVGKHTVMIDDPILTVKYVKGKNPIRIILDSTASIKSTSKIIKTCKTITTIIVVSEKATQKNIIRLEKEGLEVIKCGQNKINLKKLLHILRKKNIKNLLVEGGGLTNWSFIKDGLVDEIIVTITPYVIGGSSAISLFQGKGFDKISHAPMLTLKKINRMKNELVLHYDI
ncbi:MAG TPA: 2,5-diamino-6-(ribosylamino)-4(3H)-pyrimidinone 5'-phosphate reductase [Nitrosopumilaceae archaeon]|nr:2,5-diamino-6-(ribosylamino)-4(3H)-pyrimidinone 5'-phosphate reductase [Nitrosopumilaceae archaeon]